MEKDTTTKIATDKEFDLPAYILGEIYGQIYQEGKHIEWNHENSKELANDLKLHNIYADPEEITELMMEFDKQDYEEYCLEMGL